jgi:hypothetical protein
MLQSRGRLYLVEKPLDAYGNGKVGPEHFDGYGAIMSQVLSPIDERHTTMAKLMLNRVAFGEPGAHPVQQISLGSARAFSAVHR